MTSIQQSPASFHLSSIGFGDHYDGRSPNSSVNGVLYKKITPRKKIDKFGLDQTDYTSFVLSSTVFPTAVRTTLLGDMQVAGPHTCGFDIVERPKPDDSVSVKSASVFPVPPPTTVDESRQESLQSYPVVSFIHTSGAAPPARERHLSTTSKVTVNSKSLSEPLREDENSLSGGPNNNDEADDGGPYQSQTASETDAMCHGRRDVRTSCDSGDGRDGLEPKRESLARIRDRLEREKRSRSLPSSKMAASSKAVPKVNSFTTIEGVRLIKYHWVSRDTRDADEAKNSTDIRDTMYLNTFFPDERPVRFNKMSLPRINRGNRSRPWTVSEANISARAAAMTLGRKPGLSSRTRYIGTAKSSVLARSQPRLPVSSATSSTDVLPPKSILNTRRHGHQKNNKEGMDNDNDNDNDEDKPLLEIRPFVSMSNFDDQRDKLKGKDGCLNSRVKQCVRFVRYRERLDKQDDDRPMKYESGRYRPFSNTNIREHDVPNPPPTPEAKLQKSVETYRKYIENIAIQTKMSSPKPFTFRGVSSVNTRQHSSLTASTSGVDTDSMVVQSVMDSNLPDTSGAPSRTSMTSPRPQNSAIYTKDVSQVSRALDIKRLSPKKSINRVVAGTRGVQQRDSPARCASDSSDEGVDVGETTPTNATNAIVVPMMPPKSECASEYSMNKED
ncbi:uncharacterized protein LOC101854677 [Aplysia californica]|uniref:Uncharacterized protein LOC101854677 n=1 Tax=Aplysia californica TaxID=6500 RepID=A0ABM0K728_APLCA|nr:uncharacterized protein LOC101854677 [Aplysia californica]